MADEDDYMSASFLNIQDDIRPGLTYSKSVKRKHEIERKEKESQALHRTKSRKQLEEENRTIGMDSALSSDNKGFLLLQKMGYKPGMKLGSAKSEVSSQRGLSEPIKVKIKADRGGLGRDEEIRQRIEKRERRREEFKSYKEHETEQLTREFQERMRSKFSSQNSLKELCNIQKTCEQFDKEAEVKEPMRGWFWYTQVDPDEEEEEFYDEEEEDEEDIGDDEKVEFISDYIRSKYLYCFWCGIKYESEDDLVSNCAGPDKMSHDLD